MLVGNPFTATAQQLPNNGFKEWKGSCGTSESLGSTTGMRQRPGDEPQGWNGSSVNQKVSIVTKQQELVYKSTNGVSGNCVQLKSAKVGALGIESTAPGYISFGTPWVYAVTNLAKCDGGTYGGAEFKYRPDAVAGYFKRTDSNNEVSHIIFYSWTGTFKSNIGEKGNPTVIRDDVDRAIMNRSNASFTSDSNGELVGSADYTFYSTKNGDWEKIIVPIEYNNSNLPEKFNVVLSGSDYWTRDNMEANTELFVDDVKLIYYSRLASLGLNNTPIEGFDPDIYSYSLNVDELPTDADISVTCMGNSGSGVANIAVANRSASEAVATITVTNKNGSSAGFEDIDGKTSHTYSITFKRTLKIDLLSLIVNNEKISGPWEPTSTISTKQPFTGEIVAVLSGNIETPPTLGDREGSNDRPTRTMTVTHPEDNSVKTSYTLEFLPYIAEIEHVDMERGNSLSPNENGEIAVGQRYSVAGGVKNVTLKKSSGNPTYTCSEVKDVDIAPKIEITVVNDDAEIGRASCRERV